MVPERSGEASRRVLQQVVQVSRMEQAPAEPESRQAAPMSATARALILSVAPLLTIGVSHSSNSLFA